MRQAPMLAMAMLVAVLGPLLSACGAQSPADVAADRAAADQQAAAWSESSTNLPLFFDDPAITATRRLRDNGTIDVDAYFAGNEKLLTTEYVITTWFLPMTRARMDDREEFEHYAQKVGLSSGDVQSAHDAGRSLAGFHAQDGDCWAVAVTLRLKPPTGHEDERGQPDTILRGRNCRRLNRPIANVVEALELNDADRRAAIRAHFNHLTAEKAAGK